MSIISRLQSPLNTKRKKEINKNNPTDFPLLQSLVSSTSRLSATTELTMPALSPTMTEGTVTEWKFKLGESFNAGDVLLQIETDKASIEVEAQDDGIMGMILVSIIFIWLSQER